LVNFLKKVLIKLIYLRDWHYPLRIKNKQNKEEKQEKNITIYTTTHPEHSITSKITKTNQHIILNALLFGNYF